MQIERSMQRLKIDSKFQHEKKMKSGNTSFVGNDDDDDDRISQFPDHILVDVLSLLPLKEAGRTTVLSSRWINLWKNTHSLNFSFDFDAETAPPTHEYVKWVDTILQSHKSPTLKLFRIRYGLDTGSISDSITRWLEFAFSRQVQELELDFRACFNEYCFPEELLAPRSSLLFDSKSLKALSLKSVKMSSGTIEFFLRNCPLLEKLVLHSSGKNISKLEICGSSLVLKHLEIVTGLESLIVSAPTLTSLRVKSLKGVVLENVPMLVDVSVTREYKDVSMRHIVSVLSCCNTQLQTLHLSLMRCHVHELSNFPEMPKLKKLFIEYGLFEESLIKLAYLTRASPHLHEFVFKNKYGRSTTHGQITDAGGASIKFRHEHVKVFKFCWYEGRPDDDALVRYILENCVALEKIIIAPSSGFWCDVAVKLSVKLFAGEVDYKVNVEDDIARQLQLPHHIELVILSESDCNSRTIISNYFSVFG